MTTAKRGGMEVQGTVYAFERGEKIAGGEKREAR
jgi:hypothetical protein